MGTFQLVLGIVWRMVFWGILYGGLLGTIYGPLSLFPYTLLISLDVGGDYPSHDLASVSIEHLFTGGCIGGIMLGTAYGLVAGLGSGIALAATSVIVLRRAVEMRPYRTLACTIGSSVTALVTFLSAIAGTNTFIIAEKQVVYYITYALVPALIAGATGWWASGRALDWVEKQSRIRSDLVTSPASYL
jgi:hypothetical protein